MQTEKQQNVSTCSSAASRCGCAGLHLHDAADGGAAGGAAAAAPAAPPPSKAGRWPRSAASAFQTVSAPSATPDSPWSEVGPRGAPLLHQGTVKRKSIRCFIRTAWQGIFPLPVLPVIPGLDGLEEGLAPSSSGSPPLERVPSINISPSSASSQTPPI